MIRFLKKHKRKGMKQANRYKYCTLGRYSLV